MYYLVIIGTTDTPVYEVIFPSFKSGTTQSTSQTPVTFPANIEQMLPFVANLALDLVDDAQWLSNSLYLSKVDTFYGLVVNAFVTQGNIKFLICYDNGSGSVLESGSTSLSSSSAATSSSSKHDDAAIRQFFIDLQDLYVKCSLSPFYNVNDAITSPDFDLKVKLLAKKHL